MTQLTIDEIRELRPSFSFNGGMTLIEWFEVHHGIGFCVINSGLRHADGETKSPYYYEHSIGGENATERCLAHFSDWWHNLIVE